MGGLKLWLYYNGCLYWSVDISYLKDAYDNLENYLQDKEISISYVKNGEIETGRT